MIATREVVCEIEGKRFVGYLADGSRGRRVPGVLVAHEGSGLTSHPKERARMIPERGCIALAMDIFGERPKGYNHAMALVRALAGSPATLRTRANYALGVLKAQQNVDVSRTAAVGFCFGGTTVLELGRSGANISCIVAFHGGLRTSAPARAAGFKAKVLVCLGAADPLVDGVQREAFIQEMEATAVDWRMELYGGVRHSFTNREVDAYAIPGFAYDARADRRSWTAMCNVFDEVFGPLDAS